MGTLTPVPMRTHTTLSSVRMIKVGATQVWCTNKDDLSQEMERVLKNDLSVPGASICIPIIRTLDRVVCVRMGTGVRVPMGYITCKLDRFVCVRMGTGVCVAMCCDWKFFLWSSIEPPRPTRDPWRQTSGNLAAPSCSLPWKHPARVHAAGARVRARPTTPRSCKPGSR